MGNESTSGGERYRRLFSPLQVGPMLVPNRICETTNTIGAGGLGGTPNENFIEHHVAKARGGTGWIGHETWLLNSPMPEEAADEFQPGVGAMRFPLYMMPGFVEGLAKFFDAVHEAKSVAVCQLTHLNFTMAASSVPLSEAYDWVPHELDEDEIEFIIDTYVQAAGQFQAAGADGVEIHCAHEALPQTFLSPALNRRTDRWGGDVHGRIRFVVEILRRVKERIGNSMALGVRINGKETREGGYSHFEMREMITYIAETGTLDFVNVDVGHCWGSPAYVQPSYYGHADHREVGRAIRADVSPVPVLFSGRINDPGIAEQLLEAGACDLVGMTRAGIADPEFPKKAREGRLLELRRCIGCNRCIGESVHSYAPVMFRKPVCSVNPEVGNELFWKATYKPAARPKRVLVIGGGAAGLEAARVAAMRGHEVALMERSEALGGQVRLASTAPGRDSFEDFIIYEQNEMDRLGVDVHLGVEVSLDDVGAFEPDAVVCATGSVPRVPETPGVESAHVVQGWDVLANRAEVGECVAVISQEDHFETPNVADFLASSGKHVEIFHRWKGIGAEIDRYSIGPVMLRLEENRVATHSGLRLAGIGENKLEFRSAYGGGDRVFEGFDSVVLVYGSTPDARLYRELKAEHSIEELYLVGSAWVPRRLAEATQHGARAGLEI
jgi:2,4-dienoyl-CoA reductase-like NADH-dependent reductase (Old Yellow Enzyme family)/pyruvate/2-oxoglutarate dehydrogenase complex dihydrolipoamide dehydrogenase (E3) component